MPADEASLRYAFENLFRNSVERGSTSSQTESGDALEHDDGEVTVVVGPLDDREGYFVADDGPGIPEDQRDRVFDRGYTDDQDGTGLGLAIVARVIEAHGWELRLVESESGGARFEIPTGSPDEPPERDVPEPVT